MQELCTQLNDRTCYPYTTFICRYFLQTLFPHFTKNELFFFSSKYFVRNSSYMFVVWDGAEQAVTRENVSRVFSSPEVLYLLLNLFLYKNVSLHVYKRILTFIFLFSWSEIELNCTIWKKLKICSILRR